MLIRPWTLILLGLASVLVTLLPDHPGVVSQATSRLGFSPERVLDPFPPLTAPPTIPAHEANGLIEPGESVLGVEIDGEARTYPIDMIQYINKEVLNDALGDLPIAVSWCDLCRSRVVYDRKVDERALTFRVAGMIWREHGHGGPRNEDLLEPAHRRGASG